MYKAAAIILSVLIFLASCSEEGFSPNVQEDPVYVTYTESDIRIQSLERYPDLQDANSYQVLFEYDKTGKLVKTNRTDRQNEYTLYDYYEDGKLHTISHYEVIDNDSVITKQESVVYNANGSISFITELARQSGELKTVEINNFIYEADTLTIQRGYVNPNTFLHKLKMVWEDGNVAEQFIYSSDNRLEYSTKFSYDDNQNYKSLSPYFFTDFDAYSKNNIVFRKYENVGPLIDIACRECPIEYTYTPEGKVHEVIMPGFTLWKLNY